jgi:regulator of sirC expression with transglutaminase-like and TPR domain
MVEEGAGRRAIHGATLGGTSAAGALPGTLAAVDPTVAFAELLSRPEADVELDRAALLIAAHGRAGLHLDTELRAIDALAVGCRDGDLASVLGHLFGRLGFRGNPGDYYDPCNSYLDRVVATRRGIPITLSVLTIAVARRRGIDLVGVGMPGHFLVRSATDHSLFVDPYGAGQVLDGAGARALFHSLHGPDAAFSPTMLAPVGPRVVVTRMLNNLVAIFASRRDQQGRLWALQLRATIPGASLEDRAEVAAALAANGDFSEAGRWLEALSFEAPEPVAVGYRQAADRMRSRLN